MLREHQSLSIGNTTQTNSTRRFLRIHEVMEIVPLSRSGLYSKIKDGSFPKPFSLGSRAVGWLSTDVEDWVDSRIALTNEA
ncbi:AlpA family transcriptional regulator [Methylotenera sp.]|uniref:helix-turn-helix transcriptional regulator n=1 Tax=Methylotenera sp. TaxID=2051956 RepID=UPI0024879C94|nr:AlpA family transcriptional regulator [Methylotenera sp.]MDI1361824.1 AlpA family transcriptional regulator [Methylotenera sp.]